MSQKCKDTNPRSVITDTKSVKYLFPGHISKIYLIGSFGHFPSHLFEEGGRAGAGRKWLTRLAPFVIGGKLMG